VTTLRSTNQVAGFSWEYLPILLEEKVSRILDECIYTQLLRQVQLAAARRGWDVEGVVVRIRVLVKARADITD
jgi:hypothetical protein